MAWYRTGTITLTPGQTKVVGQGTAWVGRIQPASILFGPSGLYEVSRVVSDNELQLRQPYPGTAANGVPYAVCATQGHLADLTEAVNALVSQHDDIRQAWLTGELKGAPGTGLVIRGAVGAFEDLPPNPRPGDGYLSATGIWIWTGAEWFDAPDVRGPEGKKGDKGEKGDANTLSIGTVTTGAAGSQASAAISGEAPNQSLSLTIPRGNTGAKGDAATVTVGTVTTGAPGTAATVTNSGTSAAAVLDIRVPRGDTGEKGAKGDANTLSVGTVTKGAPGSQPAAQITGTAPNQTLNLTLPEGQVGAKGDAATVAVGTVATGAPGSQVSVTNAGTANAAVLNISIPEGQKGSKGDEGAAALMRIGTVTSSAEGTNAAATITQPGGRETEHVLSLTLPRGNTGSKGDAATVAVGTVSTGAPGSAASVTNVGTANAAVLNITIPQGGKGDKGDEGDKGATGTIEIGTVSTGAPGTAVVITNTGTPETAVLDIQIPRGADGDGSGNVNGPSSTTPGAIAVFADESGQLLAEGTLPVKATEADALDDDEKFVTSLRAMQIVAENGAGEKSYQLTPYPGSETLVHIATFRLTEGQGISGKITLIGTPGAPITAMGVPNIEEADFNVAGAASGVGPTLNLRPFDVPNAPASALPEHSFLHRREATPDGIGTVKLYLKLSHKDHNFRLVPSAISTVGEPQVEWIENSPGVTLGGGQSYVHGYAARSIRVSRLEASSIGMGGYGVHTTNSLRAADSNTLPSDTTRYATPSYVSELIGGSTPVGAGMYYNKICSVTLGAIGNRLTTQLQVIRTSGNSFDVAKLTLAAYAPNTGFAVDVKLFIDEDQASVLSDCHAVINNGVTPTSWPVTVDLYAWVGSSTYSLRAKQLVSAMFGPAHQTFLTFTKTNVTYLPGSSSLRTAAVPSLKSLYGKTLALSGSATINGHQVYHAGNLTIPEQQAQLELGDTAETAKPGDYKPTWSPDGIEGMPAFVAGGDDLEDTLTALGAAGEGQTASPTQLARGSDPRLADERDTKVARITDATGLGRSVVTASTDLVIRNLIDAASNGRVGLVEQDVAALLDADGVITATGRQLMSIASPGDLQNLANAVDRSDFADLEDSFGTLNGEALRAGNIKTINGQALTQTTAGGNIVIAAPAVTADSISDASTVGKAVLKAANDATARSAIGAVGTADLLTTYLDRGNLTNHISINVSQAGWQRFRPMTSGGYSISFTGWPASGKLGQLMLEGIYLGSIALNWSNVRWILPDGSIATSVGNSGVTFRTDGNPDFIVLWTRDGGATVYAKVIR